MSRYNFKLLQRHIDCIDAIIVVGVGYGKDIRGLRHIWPDATIYGCEPQIGFIDWHRRKHTDLVDVWFNVAISNRNGRITLFHRRNAIQASSVFPRQEEGRPICVSCTTLDSLDQRHGPLGSKILLWMDCEGSELAALQGARRLIKSVEGCMVELPKRQQLHRSGWPDSRSTCQQLSQYGFQRIGDLVSGRKSSDVLFVRQRGLKRNRTMMTTNKLHMLAEREAKRWKQLAI